MHISRGDTSSKTECVFLLQLDFFSPPNIIQYENTDTNCIAPRNDKKIALSLEQMDKVYGDFNETHRTEIGDGFFDFTKHFKYFGSFISYHMRDEYDIEQQIAEGSKAMRASSGFWNNDQVDMFHKYRICMTILENLLLSECESWALKESSLDKLDIFFHRSIRKTMNIKMIEVRDRKQAMKSCPDTLYHIPNIRALIAIRQGRLIGKVLKDPNAHPPKKY